MPDQRKAMVSSDMISLAQNCLPIFGGSKLRSTPSCLAPHTYVVNTPRLIAVLTLAKLFLSS